MMVLLQDPRNERFNARLSIEWIAAVCWRDYRVLFGDSMPA